jgi:hypothetical protein
MQTGGMSEIQDVRSLATAARSNRGAIFEIEAMGLCKGALR